MLTCWALPGCGVEETPPEPVRPVLSVVVADAAGLSGRRFPGQAKATQELNLAFEVPGRLIERPVEVGDRVELGQVLAELDPRDFAAALKSAEAELKRDQANFERAEGMLAEDVISRAQYDRLEARRDIAEASVELAAKALADSVLRAPFSGTVAATYVENYENVRSKQEIMRLLDTSKIEMVIQIPESLISNTPYVRDLQVRFDPFPETVLPASIKEVSNEASRTTRTYPVTLIMEPPEGVEILPGMAGEVWGRVELPEDLLESGIVRLGAELRLGGRRRDPQRVATPGEDRPLQRPGRARAGRRAGRAHRHRRCELASRGSDRANRRLKKTEKDRAGRPAWDLPKPRSRSVPSPTSPSSC